MTDPNPKHEDPDAQADIALDDAAAIDTDCPCRVCGYNLRGLWDDSVCPECGDSIFHSIHAYLLSGADPQWVKRLHRGTDLSIWAAVLFVATPFCGCFMGALVGPVEWGQIFAAGFFMLWFLGLWYLALGGAWKISSRERNAPPAGRNVLLKPVARWGIGLGPWIVVVAMVVETNGRVFIAGYDVLPLIVLAGLIIFSAGLIGQTLIYRRLAQRMGDRTLAGYAKAMVIDLGLMIALYCVLFVPLSSPSFDVLRLDVLWGWFFGGGGVTILVAVCLQFVLLNMLRNRLTLAVAHHEEQAREDYTGEPY